MKILTITKEQAGQAARLARTAQALAAELHNAGFMPARHAIGLCKQLGNAVSMMEDVLRGTHEIVHPEDAEAEVKED
jgi:hypothetical protein